MQASEIRGNSVRPKSPRQVSRDREGRRRRSSDDHAHIHCLAHGKVVKSNIFWKYAKSTLSYDFLRVHNFRTIDFFGKICYNTRQKVLTNCRFMRRGIGGSAPEQRRSRCKAKEKVKNEEGYARHKSLIPRRGRTVVAYTHAIFHSAFFENFSPKFGHTDPNFCFMLAKGEKE